MDQFIQSGFKLSPTLQGVVVAMILITSSISGMFSGFLADKISRVYTMALGAAIFCAGSIIECVSPNLACILVGRGVAGVGEGFFLSIIAVYCVEISPAVSRGRVTSIIQIAVTVGIAAGFFCCYGTVHLKSSFAWRVPFLIQASLALLYAIGCPLFLSFSPRWLWMKGRTSEAEEIMQSLHKRNHNDNIIHVEEWEIVGADAGERSRVRDIFRKDVRKRTILACFLMGMNQLSGIDGILYYAPVLFSQAGLSASTSKFLASGVSGLLNVFVTIVCTSFMDRMGRRISTIIGGIIMGCIICVIGSIYASGADSGSGRWVIIVCLYLFLAAFGSTWALTTRVYASEIQPLHNRAAVSSIANSCNQAVNTLVALTFPVFLSSTATGPYWLFMGCLFTTSTIAWVYMPETKGRSLASIEQVFAGKAPGLTIVHTFVSKVTKVTNLDVKKQNKTEIQTGEVFEMLSNRSNHSAGQN
ncbi:putative MFS sugar transporter [Lentinula raphanica]|uniref:MFS sugar transporter n=1 Tax=Lentinula raphanica TaxID=153919 RepID=A0AA38P699_9AGAR|nr:putative MFS sugar transporter [Lentinula raphanica]